MPALVHLCSSSQSKMARFMAALALAYMFDGRCIYTSSLVPKNTDVHNVLSPVLFPHNSMVLSIAETVTNSLHLHRKILLSLPTCLHWVAHGIVICICHLASLYVIVLSFPATVIAMIKLNCNF